MTQKHIAVLLVGICILGFFQLILTVRGKMDEAIAAANQAQMDEETQLQALDIQRQQLVQLEKGAGDLIEFLNAWEDPLKDITRPEAAEAEFISNIRGANLVTLSQRFNPVPLAAGKAISRGVSAQVVFEDSYPKLMNWIGLMEANMPALRVNDLKITKGTRPEDIRVEANLIQPIYNP